ncbi:MAG: BTAD domain-containing putative transcriptional regulator [Acidimicrobiales bacterium]
MPEPFRVNVLGPLEVRRHGAQVSIEGTKKRQLLAVLVAARGDAVPVDRLYAALWGPNPPPSARASLQSHVSRLRERVQPELEVVTMWSGYGLDLRRVELDGVRFESLVELGGRLAPVEVLGDALRLWRGDAFTGFAELPSVQGEARRLDELRLTTTERWMDARLAADEQGLVGELEALVTEHPLREHFWRQLMVALHRAGRQAEALRRGADLRTMLRELGLQPSPAILQLESRILAEDLTLRPDPGRPARRPASPHGGREPTSLIGRESDVAAVLDALAMRPVVTICGPGGVGKTRLAMRAAHAARDSFDDVVVVELAPVRDPDATPQMVAAALELEQRQHRSLEATVEDFLQDKSLLLVLDNCEHVLEAAAPLVDRLRRRCPGVTVLATSREPLGLPGEHIHLAAPLTVPAEGASSLREVADASAVQLFVDRARAARADYVLTETEAAAVAEICLRLDGLPLAVELAAARMRTMGSRALASRLDQRFALLSGDRKIADPRHRTLHHLVEWSYDLLEPAEQESFSQLSVFAGSFGLDAAESVCQPSSPNQLEAVGLLVNLIDKSMVQLIDADEPRYRLLETLRDFGHWRLEDAGRLDPPEGRHRSWYLGLAERAELGLEGPEEGRWSQDVERDFDNFRAAHASAVRCGDLDCAARLVTALQEFSFRRIRYEITNWAEATALMEGFADEPRASSVLAVSAYGHWVRGDLEAAIDLAGRSREMHEALSSAPNALAERVLGNALFYCGRTEEALAAMEAMLDGAHASGSASRLAHALYMSSVAQTSIGDPRRGADLADRAWTAADKCGSPSAAAQAAYARGVALRPVDADEAGRALQHAAELGEIAGNRWISAFALTEVHSLSAQRGDLIPALQGLAGVIDTWHRGGDWANQWLSLRHVFGVLVRLDTPRSAAVLYGALVAKGVAHALPSGAADAENMSAQVDIVRQLLAPTEFAAAVRTGAAMSDTDLIAYLQTEIECRTS